MGCAPAVRPGEAGPRVGAATPTVTGVAMTVVVTRAQAAIRVVVTRVPAATRRMPGRPAVGGRRGRSVAGDPPDRRGQAERELGAGRQGPGVDV